MSTYNMNNGFYYLRTPQSQLNYVFKRGSSGSKWWVSV